MHNAANVYARVAKTGQAPREIEASVLLNAASRLQLIHDSWTDKQAELDAALTYNRKIWTVLSSAVAEDSNPLPLPVKQNIVSLALFIFNRTITVLAEPAPEKLKILISINREIAAGLRGSSAAAPAVQAA
jgi:flagellar protein FlaF